MALSLWNLSARTVWNVTVASRRLERVESQQSWLEDGPWRSSFHLSCLPRCGTPWPGGHLVSQSYICHIYIVTLCELYIYMHTSQCPHRLRCLGRPWRSTGRSAMPQALWLKLSYAFCQDFRFLLSKWSLEVEDRETLQKSGWW